MIYSINGRLIEKTENFVVIECSGVGFRCFTTSNVIAKLGAIDSNVKLYTYLNVKEEILELYGFYDKQELEIFKLLLSVSGVGAKFALSILSSLSPDEVKLNIKAENAKAFTSAHGIGLKLAQRIILELKNKVKDEICSTVIQATNSNILEALNALMALGYSKTEAFLSIKDCAENMKVEEIIKRGLKALAEPRR